MPSEAYAVDEELYPPNAARVAARALTIATVTCRGFIENDAAQAAELWKKVLGWFDGLSLEAESEPWERKTLDTPLGELDRRTQLNAQWLCEGLVVLAWALNRYIMPAHDVQVVAADVGNSLGFLAPVHETVLRNPELRPITELMALRESLFSVHWRLREYSLRPEKIDFERIASEAWFGPLSLEGVQLVQGDLAVGDQPIWKADLEATRSVASIAQERHRAINWLVGEHVIYSETETNT